MYKKSPFGSTDSASALAAGSHRVRRAQGCCLYAVHRIACMLWASAGAHIFMGDAASAASFLRRRMYRSPHELHSDCLPCGPLRHRGVVSVRHAVQRRDGMPTALSVLWLMLRPTMHAGSMPGPYMT